MGPQKNNCNLFLNFTAKYGYNSYVMEIHRYVVLLYFPSKFFEMASRLHVTLLVLLRLLAIKFPLTYQEMHIKISRISIALIWIISLIVTIIVTFIGTFDDKGNYFVAKIVLLHGFGTFPVICIVFMNASLLRTLSQKRPSILTPSQGQNNTLNQMDSLRKEVMNRKMTILVLKVVGFLMFCYIPLIAWRHHYYSVVVYRENSLLTDTEVYICQFKNTYPLCA